MKIVTATPGPHNIGYVPACNRAGSRGGSPLPDLGLTKRRAVDFCRVATSLCPVALARGTTRT
jgi:hypothetical protein